MAKKRKESKGTIFDRFETKMVDYISRGAAATEEELKIKKSPHLIKLQKGTVPYHEVLSPYHKFSRAFFGRAAIKYIESKEEFPLAMDLIKAHYKMRVEDYLSFVWMTTLIVGILGVGTGVMFLIFPYLFPALTMVTKAIIYIVALFLFLSPLLTYVMLMWYPSYMAKERAKQIDKKIGYAMNFIATLASADVTVDVIFKELGKQSIYGEVQKEAQWITRDIEILGKDVLTAIRDAAARTPSTKFQDFLQGVVTTTLSGGQLKPYFLMKSEQYAKLMKLEQKKSTEARGLIAEIFVTVVVALPLFLIVMISLLGMMGGRGAAQSTLLFLYLIVLVVIPVSQGMFLFYLQAVAEGGE